MAATGTRSRSSAHDNETIELLEWVRAHQEILGDTASSPRERQARSWTGNSTSTSRPCCPGRSGETSRSAP